MSVAGEPLVLVLPNGARYPVVDYMTIGRADEATVRIDDRTVSRTHARIDWSPEGPMIADAGSRFGIVISGQKLTAPRRLFAGQEIQLGNVVLRVEGVGRAAAPVAAAGQPHPAGLAGPIAPRGFPPPVEAETPSHQTMVVPVGATQLGMRAPALPSSDGALRPRLRSGWALKRLEDEFGQPERYVLRDLVSGTFRRLDAVDAKLVPLLDGRRTVPELLVEAANVGGPSGGGRLARLIADFGERGMLDGIEPTPQQAASTSLLARAFKRRDWTIDWLPEYFQTAYRHWGRVFFSPLSVTALVLLSFAGLFVFSYLVGARFGTPFVVAHRLVLGGAVFIAGRFLLVIFHELAHGLALAHYGRRAGRSGFRLTFIFPYAFVDSSEAYFETRAHRIWISLAGPLSDLSMGAIFSIACAVSARGNVRDVLFQLAFAGYVGAFFNLNPFLDRDGYQVLVEWLREPGLKQRARQQLRQRLTGRVTGEQTSPVLIRYATAGLVWSAIGAAVVAVMSIHYYKPLTDIAPRGVVLGGFIAFFGVLLVPVTAALVVPLFQRARYGSPEVNRVVQ